MAEQTSDWAATDDSALKHAGDPAPQENPQPAATRSTRKAEDTSEGCHAMAANDRERASENVNERMKAVFERSASAWSTRGEMFKRLEAQRESRNDG
jgi:hypothetical protein